MCITCIYVCVPCAYLVLWRPDERVRCSGTGIPDVSCLLSAGNQTQVSWRWLTVDNCGGRNLALSIPFGCLRVGRRQTGFPLAYLFSAFLDGSNEELTDCRREGTQTPSWLLRRHHFFFFFFVGVWLYQSLLCSNEWKHRPHWLSHGQCLTGQGPL